MVDLSLLIVPRVRIYLGENGMHVLGFTSMGGAAALVHSGELLFSHFGDNRVYKTDGKQTPKAITPAAGKVLL